MILVDKDESIFANQAGGEQCAHFPAWQRPHGGNLHLLTSSGYKVKVNVLAQQCSC